MSKIITTPYQAQDLVFKVKTTTRGHASGVKLAVSQVEAFHHGRKVLFCVLNGIWSETSARREFQRAPERFQRV